MEPDQQLRNLRDFLLVYNRMTEICFQRCSSNFNYRNLTMDELMPRMVQRRMEEMESKAAENAKAAEAKAATASEAVGTEMAPSSALQTPNTSSPLSFPPELNAPVSKNTPATEVKLSAAAPLTPIKETLNPSVLDKAGIGPSYTTECPQSPIAGAQIDSGSSAPLFMPSKPTSLSEDAPVLTAPPAGSKS